MISTDAISCKTLLSHFTYQRMYALGIYVKLWKSFFSSKFVLSRNLDLIIYASFSNKIDWQCIQVVSKPAVCLHFISISAVCLHVQCQNQLFVYIFFQEISAILTQVFTMKIDYFASFFNQIVTTGKKLNNFVHFFFFFWK